MLLLYACLRRHANDMDVFACVMQVYTNSRVPTVLRIIFMLGAILAVAGPLTTSAIDRLFVRTDIMHEYQLPFGGTDTYITYTFFNCTSAACSYV